MRKEVVKEKKIRPFLFLNSSKKRRKSFSQQTKNRKILLVWSTKSVRALLYYSLWWTDVTRTLYNLKRVDNATGELWLRQWPLCPWGLSMQKYTSLFTDSENICLVYREKKRRWILIDFEYPCIRPKIMGWLSLNKILRDSWIFVKFLSYDRFEHDNIHCI